MTARPRPPKGAGPAGRRLWQAVLAAYELEQHEELLLRELVRTADLLDELQATLDVETLTIETSQGRRVNPVAAELRQQRVAFARLAAALRLPAGEESDPSSVRRPQRRVGVRGVYGVGEAS